MIEIRLKPPINNLETHGYLYGLADGLVWFDQPILYLAPFFLRELSHKITVTPLPKIPAQTLPAIYKGPGWIANEWREVRCQLGEHGYILSVAGAGCFHISSDGAFVALIHREDNAQENIIIESALGPALILSLAIRGAWCLHASAALYGDQLLLFSGESGVGKSTLARRLGARPEWRRVGDDILPIARSGDNLYALPAFPQLKIPSENQPSLRLAPRLKIHTIYFLKKQIHSLRAQSRQLRPLDAALMLSRHTVASRLFDKALLKIHLDFCSWVAENHLIKQLDYPHTQEGLEKVMKLLEEDLT